MIKKRSEKAGLPPGSLVHIGPQRTEEPKITIFDFDETRFEERETRSIDECLLFKGKTTVTWINLEGLHEIRLLEELGNCYGIHPLVLEDILNTDQRPKMEDYGEYIYIVLKMLYPGEADKRTEVEQVSLILGPNYVFSFQEGGGDVFGPIRERIRNGKGRLRKMGADFLAYSLLDAVIDGYFIILEQLGERVETLEDELVVYPRVETLQQIHHLKREMIFLRKAVWPLREVVGGLERVEPPLVQKTTGIYLRDVYDHVIQVIDTVETFRDMLSGMLDIYLSSVSNRLNSVMKVLTIIATIFMPLTFIAGVYGMNFKHMPELEWRWGYPAVWGVFILIAVSMLFYFKRKKWL